MPKYAKNCKNRLTDTETDKHIKARDLKILVLKIPWVLRKFCCIGRTITTIAIVIKVVVHVIFTVIKGIQR